MKKLVYISAFLLSLLICTSFKSNNPPLISYTESSSGLQTVQWDGGRTEVEFADIDNDGFKDIISIGDHGNPYINTQMHGFMMYFGNGTGANWNLIQFGNFGYGGIAAGDVNGDGKMDFGYGMHHNYSSNDLGDQIFEVALGDGTGNNWTAWDDGLATNGETWGMFTTDFGDINNDGKLDVGSISFGCCAGLHVYKNNGNGTWTQTFGFNSGNSSMEFQFGDMNNDGNLDFASAHQTGTPYFGDGSGNFVLRHNNLPAAGNTGLKGVSLGDVNNDGAKDLAFLTSTGGGVNVWRWDDITTGWINLSAGLPSSSSYQTTLLYDMNSDGFCDLILYGNTSCVIYTGNGGSNWTQAASFSTPPNGSYQDITAADADNNGFSDIAMVNNEGSGFNTRNYLRFWKETSTPTALSVRPLYPTGGEKFKNNSVKFIEWISADPPPLNAKIKLELSTTGNGGPWTLIKDSLPNNGRYQWNVPPAISSNNCFIRYTVFEGGSSSTGMNTSPFHIGNFVGINSNNNQFPAEFMLCQNYPNPFNPKTKIKYQIANTQSKIQKVELSIYNILGEKIKVLVNEEQNPGIYEVEWDASNYPSGVYYYQLKVSSGQSAVFKETKKMVLTK